MAQAFHKIVSRKQWTQDFLSVLGLEVLTSESVHAWFLQKYKDQGIAKEYAHRIWNAYCYFRSIQPQLEEAGLAVIGQKGALIKDAVPWALYSYFAACDVAVAHIMDLVPLNKIIELAIG